MLAGTPTITAEELAKRLADPETYPCHSAGLQSKHRDGETCLCSFCRSPQGSATESCDDTPKWRKTLAACEEEEEAEGEEEQAEDITKMQEAHVLTCQDHLQAQGGERCQRVTPPGASANEQANIRLTKFHGKHAGVPGWSEMNQSSQTRPCGRNLRVWSEILVSMPLPRCQ